MSDRESLHRPFFLTQASANILEELASSTRLTSSVSLLYGVAGVGKSCLINHFIHSRLGQDDYILIRFLDQGLYSCKQLSNQPESQVSLFQKIEAELSVGVVLIFDQLEKALPDIVSQMFDFWDRQSVKSHLKMILICDTYALKNVYESSHSFQIKVSSVEIKRLSDKDQIAFLESRVCDGPRQKLLLNNTLRKALKNAQGLFSRLDKIPKQFSNDLMCSQRTSLQRSGFDRPWLTYSILISVFFIFGAYLVDGNKIIFPVQSNITMNEIESGKEENPTIASTEIIQQKQTNHDSVAEETLGSGLITEETQNEATVKHMNTLNQDANQRFREKVESKIVPQLNHVLPPAQPQKVPDNQLKYSLQAMNVWLKNTVEDEASIQIMTVRHNEQSETSLNRYLNKLQSKSIDISQIKIFSSIKKDQKFLGVLFGEYKNRAQAVAQISKLPDILRENKPIPRTVKGIRKEINIGTTL